MLPNLFVSRDVTCSTGVNFFSRQPAKTHQTTCQDNKKDIQKKLKKEAVILSPHHKKEAYEHSSSIYLLMVLVHV